MQSSILRSYLVLVLLLLVFLVLLVQPHMAYEPYSPPLGEGWGGACLTPRRLFRPFRRRPFLG